MFGIPNNFVLCGIFIQLLFGFNTGLKIYNFHDECENTLEAEAGELCFDALKMPTYSFDSKCSVKVQPKADNLPKPIHVAFYFTKFDLSGACADMSVSVTEGSTFQKPVTGLPEHICGRNQSLEETSQIFTTKTDEFTVSFEREATAKYSRGNFTIKFIAFYLGKCQGNGVYNCSNGHCISSTYECSNDINSCADNGEHLENCELLKAVTELVKTIVEVVGEYSWIILVIIGLCVLKCWWKKCKDKIDCNCSRKCSDCLDCISDCCQCISNGCEAVSASCVNQLSSTPTDRRRDSLQLQDIHMAPRSAHENASEISGDVDGESSPEFIRLDPVNDYDFQSEEQSSPRQQTSPDAPPPSYDEVMTSSHASASAPSYEDVIKNRHKYETDI